MGLAPTGMGAVLNIKEMAEAMVAGDMTHIQVRQDRKVSIVDSEISALGQLKSALSSFQTTMTNLSNMSQFYKMKYSISDPTYFSATVTDKAKAGVYQVQVQALAQSQSLSSGYFANNTTSVGSGNITIKFGTYSSDLTSFTENTDAAAVTIKIDPTSDSLTNICDAINAANSGVTANIVQDSQGSRLSLTTTKTGEAYAMQITSDITALNYDPTSNNTALTQNMAAQNSIVTINGMTLSQSTNQLNDVFTGISLNLKKADIGQTVSLTVENNQEQLTSTLNDFVKQFNDCMLLLNTVTGVGAYDKKTKKVETGYFQGDSQVISLKNTLKKIISDFMVGGSPSGEIASIKSLADLGITFNNNVRDKNKAGLLEIDKTKMDAAVAKNFSSIGALFAKTITATDPNIQISSIDTKAPAGTYNLNLSVYEPGGSVFGTLGKDDANNLSIISKDGVVYTGSKELSTLSFSILGGSTGDRGQITVTDGLAAMMDTILDGYIGKKSEFETKEINLNHQRDELKRNQEKIDQRSELLLKRYMKQWGAVDVTLKKMQDTSGMLTEVLAQLPKLKLKS